MEVSAPLAAGRSGRRGTLPSFVVLLVIAVVVFGGYVVAGALARPAGPPIMLAGVVRVSPLSGWDLAGRLSQPAGLRLTRGSGNLDVLAFPFPGDATALEHEYVSQILDPNAERLSVSPDVERVTLRSGLAGVRIHYVGLFGLRQSAIEGEVTAIVTASGHGIVFDTWAPQGLLQFVVGDTRAMVDDAEVA